MGSYEVLRQSGLNFANLLSDPEEEKEMETSSRRMSSRSSSKSLQRQNSEASINSATESILEDVPEQAKEKQQMGSIGSNIYKSYFAAGGGPFILIITALFFILAQLLASSGDYFLSYWVNSNESPLKSPPSPETFASPKVLRDSDNSKRTDIDIYIFTGIIVFTVAIALSRSFLFFSVAMKASTNLHNSMFKGITHASMHFFHTNPTGRILNRFSKDMGQVDEILPGVMMDVLQIFLSLFGMIIVIALVNPLFLIPTIVLAVVFYFLRVFYLKTSRDVKRIEGISEYFVSVYSLN